jgi:DNA-binding NarL/FixJ family response regulator
MPTVFLIDDHAMFREGLLLALRAAAPELDFEAFSNGAQALAVLPWRPDVHAVMIDYYLPDLAGAALLARLRAVRPDLRLLVITASEDQQDMQAALSAGAHGFVHKSADSHALVAALNTVLRGERYLSASRHTSGSAPAWRSAQERGGGDLELVQRLASLTPRQREVLQLVCEGLRNGEIGERLGMMETTVKGHVSSIMAVLGALNRTQAAALARRAGLLGKPA